MLYTIFCILPCMTCLLWLVIFLLGYRQHDSAKRQLTLFVAVCTVLYGCHAAFFSGVESRWLEGIWVLCSMNVYPLYYLYICRLTCSPIRPVTKVCIALGSVVALWYAFSPSVVSSWARQIVFAVQVVTVVYFGWRRLHRFDEQLHETYADMENKSTSHVRVLLAFFLIISLCSAVVNVLGRELFVGGLIAIPSLLFSVMLFAICYIGYLRQFSSEQFCRDIQTDMVVDGGKENYPEELPTQLKKLMEEKRLYLQYDLKIVDVARELGVCRTYISACINQTAKCSFSEYINRMRIDYASALMRQHPEKKMVEIAEASGYQNEQSFYRNFRKYTGSTPNKNISR